MEELATDRSFLFRPPKGCKEEVSLLERSKPKSTQYKISGLLMFSEIGKLRARKKIPLVEPGNVL